MILKNVHDVLQQIWVGKGLQWKDMKTNYSLKNSQNTSWLPKNSSFL